MTIKPEYFAYLKHFRKTETLYQYFKSKGSSIALRHDVDHCIDTALEMAYWEHESGIKSSYFMLHTASYMADPLFYEKCFQIQEFGHEIGIHTNFISQWYEMGGSPRDHLELELNKFRDSGINIHGTSAHGDRACYRSHFINYWLFKELRPEDPEGRESNLNAEGIVEADESKQIKYPSNHVLRRENGEQLSLWQLSQEALALSYEASHLHSDMYFTDSGGGWKRSPDPLDADLKNSRVLVLIHPVHWKAPRRIYFFLSTARSGSKWLSTVLDRASSCKAKHEYTLNNYSSEDGGHYADKMTGRNLKNLLEDSEKVISALKHTRKIVDEMACDYAESNVYLPLVLDQLNEFFPDATLIHLHRNPSDVVRSIMNRGWYDTPDDTAHPDQLIENWNRLSPFEKCCVYVKVVSERLREQIHRPIVFEQMVSDFDYLKQVLKSLGIAFYPHLAKEIINQRINENKLSYFPEFSDWSPEYKQCYRRYCSDVAQILGYRDNKLTYLIKIFIRMTCNILIRERKKITEEISVNLLPESLCESVFTNNCEKSCLESGLILKAIDERAHAYALINGGRWSKLEDNSGWQLQPGGYYSIHLASRSESHAKIILFCLFYDNKGDLIYKRALGSIEHDLHVEKFSFAAMGNSPRFNLAIYMPKQALAREVVIDSLEITFQRY